MEKILFADTFTKSLKKVIVKVPSVTLDDPVFRLHYKVTGLALLFSSILVSGYQFFGKPIMCIQKDDIPNQLLNTYCWIESTFTLPKAFFKEVGTEVVYPGVDKYNSGDEVLVHSYYQWVCFVLFLQCLAFAFPYYIWRVMEAGKMKALVKKLKNPMLPESEKQPCFAGLAHYFSAGQIERQQYALKYLFCEILNFVNVVCQIVLIDQFLGGEFGKFGIDVVKYANTEQEDRFDPMIKIFPRITKCTFHKHGSSGDVQRHDALCLLPLNIINEKIFIVMWFWFIILAILGGSLIVYRLIIMMSERARFLLLSCVSSLTEKEDIEVLIPSFTYGDWFFLYLLADNIDNLYFREFILQLKMNQQMRGTFNPNVLHLDDVDKGMPSKESTSLEEKSLIEKDESSV